MMLGPFDLSRYRSILCLNSSLPDADFFRQAGLPIIAADGAANRLHEFGIKPQIIIGDLDSVDPDLRLNSATLYQPDQSTSDFHKSLHYLEEQNLLPTMIVGIQDGFMDHVLNNINLFMGGDNLFYAPPILGMVISKDLKMTLPINSKISIFGMPEVIISTSGLKWELNNNLLSFPGQNSCFNRTLDPTIHFQIHEGKALMLVYLIPMQDAGG